ncbi:MAG: carotenoid oxygenase family protein, partial [Pseudomonadota bacterium]
PGVFGSEAVFAPRNGATRAGAEDDGYVTTLVTDSRDWSSWCLVFDATDIEQGPVARVRMPHRVPYGFHATWARGSDLWGRD